MRLAFFLVILCLFVPVECRPRLQDSERLAQHPQGQHKLNMATNVDTSAGPGRFYSALNGSVRESIYRGFLGILPVRTTTSNFVSIFDLRRKLFLCMDLKGELYTSRQRGTAECLFQHIWLDLVNQHKVLHSAHGRRLLRLRGGHLLVAHGEPPEPLSALSERVLVKRQRRSEDVNPSDPLRTEAGKDPRDADVVQPERDQTGTVSKETISSCDDPLSVLRLNAPGSPVKTNIADRAEQDYITQHHSSVHTVFWDKSWLTIHSH